MTEPGFGFERPEADVAEQLIEDDPTEEGSEPIGELPVDANPADVVEQRLRVPIDDEDRG